MFDLATKKIIIYLYMVDDDVINIRGHRVGCEDRVNNTKN